MSDAAEEARPAAPSSLVQAVIEVATLFEEAFVDAEATQNAVIDQLARSLDKVAALARAIDSRVTALEVATSPGSTMITPAPVEGSASVENLG